MGPSIRLGSLDRPTFVGRLRTVAYLFAPVLADRSDRLQIRSRQMSQLMRQPGLVSLASASFLLWLYVPSHSSTTGLSDSGPSSRETCTPRICLSARSLSSL